MLASKYRLTGETNFKRVEREGEVFQYENFGLALFDRKDGEASKFGFVVSTKIAKPAVDRNRLRRIMREAVRTSLFEIKGGFDCVFLAKPIILRHPTDEIMREVKKAIGEHLVK